MKYTAEQLNHAKIKHSLLDRYQLFDFGKLCDEVLIYFKANSHLINIPEYRVGLMGMVAGDQQLGIDIFLDSESSTNYENQYLIPRCGVSITLLLDAGNHANNLKAETELAARYQMLLVIAYYFKFYMASIKDLDFHLQSLRQLGLTSSERAVDKFYATIEIKGSFGIITKKE